MLPNVIIMHSSETKKRKTETAKWLATTAPARFIEKLPNKIRRFKIRSTVENLFYLPFTSKIERPRMSRETQQNLTGFLSEDIDQLRSFTGRDLKDWSV